jgi:hypothetical protein
MATISRVKGDQLTLIFGTGTNTRAEVTSATLEHEDSDSDLLTFAEAAQGGASQPFFNITLVQSTTAGSLWRTLWDAAGTTVAFTYAPHGNAAPTADQPHFVGFVKIPALRPTIGGDAVRGGPGHTAEVRLDVCDEVGGTPGTVTMDTGATSGGGD